VNLSWIPVRPSRPGTAADGRRYIAGWSFLAKAERTKTSKRAIQRRIPNRVTDLPTSVLKSYFMLPDVERAVLNTALEKFRPGQSEAVLVAGRNVLKPALRLMTSYWFAIDEIRIPRRSRATRGGWMRFKSEKRRIRKFI
jgi:hypothetical protein